MTFLLSSSIPADGASDIQINKSIELIFNKNVTASIADGIINLIDVGSGKIVPTTASRVSTLKNKVILTLDQHLIQNNSYRIQITGSDLGYSFFLEAEDGEYLVDTVFILFTTGTETYSIDSTLEKEVQDLTREGDLFLPNNLKALGYDFTLSYVRPKNHSINVGVTVTGDSKVNFTFNKTLYTGSSDYTSWADVSVYPILDSTGYFADSSNNLGLGTAPGYSIGVSGQVMSITFDGDLPKNASVTVALSNNIESSDGDFYSGEMDYIFHTSLYPSISAVETIKREVRFVAISFYDDFINSLLFKNAIWLWEKTGRVLNLSALTFPAIQYVIYSTCLDLIDDKDLEKYILGGTRKRLADMDISYTALLGKMATKAARLEEQKKVALETIFKGKQTRVGVLDTYITEANGINRLWYDINSRYTNPGYRYLQPNEPISNTTIARNAKTNNPFYL